MKLLRPISYILIAIVFVLVLVFGVFIDYVNEQHITAKVIKTDVVMITSGTKNDIKLESQYLVFTDKGTFKVTDQLLFGKFNSSDLFGKLEPGKTYNFTVYGFRVPILSMYQNIREYK